MGFAVFSLPSLTHMNELSIAEQRPSRWSLERLVTSFNWSSNQYFIPIHAVAEAFNTYSGNIRKLSALPVHSIHSYTSIRRASS